MQEEIAKIVMCAAQGMPVVFPTETVFALAADARNPEAIDQIYRLKARQKNKPLAILCDSLAMAQEYVDVNPQTRRVMARYMPGALTCVLPIKKGANLAFNLNEGVNTLGVRLPDHPVAMAIIKALGAPVAATSVNLSGEQAAVTEAQVKAFCAEAVPFMLPENSSEIKGLASTVVDFTASTPKLLREGGIAFEDIIALYQRA